MAVLEKIRKRTTVLILIIGLALFAFVISGIFSADDFSGNKVGSAVAEVNGDEISIDAFRQRLERTSRQMGPAGVSSLQLVNTVYNQEVRETILEQQFEDLGIDIEQDQIINIIKSNPSYAQAPQFLDENGVFSESRFREFIVNLRDNFPDQYQLWLQDEKAIIQGAKEQTYFNLIKAGSGATLLEGELDYKLANDKVDIQYVRVPYTSIQDSTISVSKGEIASYIEAHPEEFKQDKARDIQFVYFQEKASASDEKAVEEELKGLLVDRVEYNATTDRNDTIKGFAQTADVAAFLDRHSDTQFDTIYKAKNSLPTKFADSILALEVGELFGPYRDGNFYKVTRMMGKKPAGSVKASHILVAYEGAERANPAVTRTKEEAEQKAKELLQEAKKGDTPFVQLARENSDGPSASRGGDLGYFQEGVMTEKFNDFAFGNSVEHVGLVETEFGFHIVRVDDKQDVVQVATLSREVVASENTVNQLFADATQFEMDALDAEGSFADLATEKGYVSRPVRKLKEMDENLPGLGIQRQVVQWAFNDETDLGTVKRFNLNDGYAIVQLTGKYQKGQMDVEDASALVIPKLRREKKADQIKTANAGKTMDAFAKDNGVSVVNAPALTMKSPTIPGVGREPMVVGAAFGLDEGAASGLIVGETGVFMVSPTKKEAASQLDNYSTYATTLGSSNALRVNGKAYQALQDASEIEDNRAVFY